MPDNYEFKRIKVREQLKHHVEMRSQRGPIQDADLVRRATEFFPTARQVTAKLRANADNNPRGLGGDVVRDIADEMTLWLDEYPPLLQEFLAADVGVVRRGRPNLQYGPVLRSCAEQAAEVLQALRSAVGDTFDNGNPIYRALREGCGVGAVIRFESPVEVQRALHMACAVLNDPVYASALALYGLRMTVLRQQVEEARAKVDAGLEAGHADAALVVRARRDEAQLGLEAIVNAVLALTATALGKEQRDELRALWPSSTSQRKTEDSTAPQEVEEVVTTANGSVVPAPVITNPGNTTGTGTPLSNNPSTVTGVPLLQPLFGTSTPTPMIAGAASNGTGSGSNGHSSNGVNGAPNGHG